MSLLQEHANNLKNNLDRGQELATASASQKAQGLDQKYNEMMEHYNSGVMGVSTLSGAFHKGRKVYRGLQKARAAQVASSAPTPVPATSGEERADRIPTRSTGEPLDLPESAFGHSARRYTRRAARLANPAADGTVSTAGANPTGEETVSGGRTIHAPTRTVVEPDATAGEGHPSEMLQTPRSVRQSSERAITSAGDRAATTPVSNEPVEPDAPASNPVRTAIRSAIGAEGEAGAMTALDAVPVVGELAGAGLGLYSLFKGIFDPPPTEAEELAKQPTPAESSAIDPTAVAGKA